MILLLIIIYCLMFDVFSNVGRRKKKKKRSGGGRGPHIHHSYTDIHISVSKIIREEEAPRRAREKEER
jgi:UDP-N-acetylmuramyl pentapeptide phosphotransferase/UDP-N-acetylglucosamine-1-phosphate transferase